MSKRLLKIFVLFLTFLFIFNKTVYAEEISIDNQNEEENVVNDINEKENVDKIEEELTETNETTKYTIIIEDDANLLSNEEKIKIKEKMTPLSEYGNIAFKTIDNNPLSSADRYAEKYYHDHFKTESGTLFLIDMDTRNIYIFSDGYNYKVITRDKAYIITDNVYSYASYKDYYKCAYEAFDQIKTLLDGGKILEPMRYASNIVISITIGAFVAFFIAVKMTSNKKVSEKEILKMMNSHLVINSIEAVKSGSHKVYSPRSDGGGSSGGSSSGGGGGGGGSSGGGGGHSF